MPYVLTGATLIDGRDAAQDCFGAGVLAGGFVSPVELELATAWTPCAKILIANLYVQSILRDSICYSLQRRVTPP